MAARVVNKVGLEANHHNFLLHAMPWSECRRGHRLRGRGRRSAGRGRRLSRRTKRPDFIRILLPDGAEFKQFRAYVVAAADFADPVRLCALGKRL